MPILARNLFPTAARQRILAVASMTCLLIAPALRAEESPEAFLKRHTVSKLGDAQELLKKGDDSYRASKWKDAMTAYEQAYHMLARPESQKPWRDAAGQRYAQATVEYAKDQQRHGDVKGAVATLDVLLAKENVPDYGPALTLREQLQDPIRTNPALTKEHAKQVEEVTLLLYKAEGAYNIGDYDLAKRVYEDVLRTDPYNTAARRGMEKVLKAKSDYYRAANDQTRADMLADVAKQWETPLAPEGTAGDVVTASAEVASGVTLEAKLNQIIIPVVAFDDIKISEALDFLRARSRELDTVATDPRDKGVNLILNLGNDEKSKEIEKTPIHLSLKNTPMSQVLQYITEITHSTMTIGDSGVVIQSPDSENNQMVTRTYNVSADFFSVLEASGSSDDSGAAADPFAKKQSETLTAKRRGPVDILKAQGIAFPEGASLIFNAGGGTITVRNTVANLTQIKNLVDSVGQKQIPNVVVEVKILKTEETRLQELGFDWLLSPAEFSKRGFIAGGAQEPANMADIAAPTNDPLYSRDAITSGNRSGTEAVSTNSIDDVIANGIAGTSPQRGSGVLWANGTLNGGELTTVIRAMDQKKGISLMAQPSVVTRSGQEAKVTVARELIYPTEYEPPQLPNSVGGGSTTVSIDLTTGQVLAASSSRGAMPVTPSTPTSFDKRNVGISLSALPTVSEDKNYVDLAIKPDISDFDGFINYGTPITDSATDLLGNPSQIVLTKNEILMPVFSSTRTESHLTIQNGSTVVIGGLLSESVENVQDKTPILGDLPLVGRFFQSNVYQPKKTAVVLFVTVRVLDQMGRPYNQN
jgi:general secretion pathway protein D